MAVKLNLIPEESKVSKDFSQAIKIFKSLGVILIVIFVISSLGVVAFFIFSKISLNNMQTQVSQLTAQVKAYEGSEQQLVLLKDRLSKIASIRSTANASKNITNMDSVFENMSPGLLVQNADISPAKIDFSLVLSSNEDLTTFIQNLKTTSIFNYVSLSSLTFSERQGFSLEVNLVNK